MQIVTADDAAATFPNVASNSVAPAKTNDAPVAAATPSADTVPSAAAKQFKAIAKFEPKKDDQIPLVKGAIYTLIGMYNDAVSHERSIRSLTLLVSQMIPESGG